MDIQIKFGFIPIILQHKTAAALEIICLKPPATVNCSSAQVVHAACQRVFLPFHELHFPFISLKI